MVLTEHVRTLGRELLERHGERVHKVAIHAGFTCPNRDGTLGRGGCTFCNNRSFSPNARRVVPIAEQIAAGRRVIRRRTGARKYLAYFQAYTNTYGKALEELAALYEAALAEPDVIGLAVGTRPDCVPDAVLDLLAGYQARGYEVWLELGLQSAWDVTLERVNRGHGFAAYRDAIRRAHARGLKVCTHLILGLPGETSRHAHGTLDQVLALGVEGLKFHPLHVVRHTLLAHQWRRGRYRPLTMQEYVSLVVDLLERTPPEVVIHRVTGTAGTDILLAPAWCAHKWIVINAIVREFRRRSSRQGCRVTSDSPDPPVAPPAPGLQQARS
ncbi:MAG: TIGR01212 family radical SAM protein [Gammaproteobacteria bacterium]|nr:MAG: TIGR01212 family radical SAM protein [Gammaproteobacteria bacterium]